jgi:hypothetical protein
MGRRQFADDEGHRWDVEDEVEVEAGGVNEGAGGQHRLRFKRDDGSEEFRTSPLTVDQLADVELRALLRGEHPGSVPRGPDTEANESGGYGSARD